GSRCRSQARHQACQWKKRLRAPSAARRRQSSANASTPAVPASASTLNIVFNMTSPAPESQPPFALHAAQEHVAVADRVEHGGLVRVHERPGALAPEPVV